MAFGSQEASNWENLELAVAASDNSIRNDY